MRKITIIKDKNLKNTFEFDWPHQCNILYSFHLPRKITINCYNFYQNFIHSNLDIDHIEYEVKICDGFVQDEKRDAKKCPLVCPGEVKKHLDIFACMTHVYNLKFILTCKFSKNDNF